MSTNRERERRSVSIPYIGNVDDWIRKTHPKGQKGKVSIPYIGNVVANITVMYIAQSNAVSIPYIGNVAEKSSVRSFERSITGFNSLYR